MTTTESESTSPVSQDDQPLRTSRSSSATAASSATSASFDLPDLEEDDQHHQPDVAIAGLDKGFDELDLGGGSEVAGGDVKQSSRAKEAVDVDHVGKDLSGTEEVSEEEEQEDDTVERPEGNDEEDPVYPYTMALFEYTVSQPSTPLLDRAAPAYSTSRPPRSYRNDNTLKLDGSTNRWRGINIRGNEARRAGVSRGTVLVVDV